MRKAEGGKAELETSQPRRNERRLLKETNLEPKIQNQNLPARVLVIVNNLQQASFRVRIAAIAPLMPSRGFEFEVALRPRSWFPRRRLLRSASEYHAVIIQRKLLEPSDARLLRRSAGRIYYDIDDAVMYHNRSVRWLSRWQTSRKFLATTRIIDHVVAGNEYLADIFRRHGRSVTVLPTVVDPSRYKIRVHQETQSPRLVWIGSHSTISYLRQFLPALEDARRVVPGLRLLTIADQTLASSVLPIEHIPWSAETEADALCHGDIGIAPTPIDRWTLGKCGFKIVQYMASGLPVIASPVGANAELVREGVTGLLPHHPNDWPDAIARLCTDKALRVNMGSAGRALVEQRYNLEYVADEWAHVLE